LDVVYFGCDSLPVTVNPRNFQHFQPKPSFATGILGGGHTQCYTSPPALVECELIPVMNVVKTHIIGIVKDILFHPYYISGVFVEPYF